MNLLNPMPRTSESRILDKAPLVCFSHLRWDFVLQRPQHLMQRFSQQRQVFFFEEYIPTDHHLAYLEIHPFAGTTVKSVRPRIPHWWNEADRQDALGHLLDELLELHGGVKPILWYYTPLMYAFSAHIDAAAVVYDCMDELANFKFAPVQLKDAERALMARADAVFTGGVSLFEAKRDKHDNIHAFPSSVDIEHFRATRNGMAEPADQAAVPGPKLGYYGVIDERLDLGLIAAVSRARPDLSLIFLGPVVKISQEELPRAANIHYLGLKSYADLPAYLSGWDAALMPFALNEATRFISPTKTPEYLAAGRPVVSTRVTDVARAYGNLEGVFLATGSEDFVAACDRAIALAAESSEWLREVDAMLIRSSWDKTFHLMSDIVAKSMISSARRQVRPLTHHPLAEEIGATATVGGK